MSSTRPIKRIGVPMVLAVPTPQIRAMKMQDLRKLVRDVVNPWLNSGRGWTAGAGDAKGDVDSDLYNICLMDRAADQVIRVLPYVDPESGSEDLSFDLLEMANSFHAKNRNLSSGMSFGLEWKIASPQALAEKLNQDVESLRYPAHILAATRNTPKKVGLDLSDCLQAFAKEETLRKSEAWYCSACRDHMEATKKLDVFKLPNILIIHLKRFVYDSYRRDKIDSYVDFPLEGLDLAPFTVGQQAGAEPGSSLYDLYAVSNHYGGMGGGHYTAYVKNLINQKWSALAPQRDAERRRATARMHCMQRSSRDESACRKIHQHSLTPSPSFMRSSAPPSLLASWPGTTWTILRRPWCRPIRSRRPRRTCSSSDERRRNSTTCKTNTETAEWREEDWARPGNTHACERTRRL